MNIVWIINLLLTKRKGSTGEYWPEVVAVRTKGNKVLTEMTEGHFRSLEFDKNHNSLNGYFFAVK